jgi:polar amino acid transport system permease protein
MADLLHSVQVIYNQTYEIVPLLLVACIWYLVLVTLLTIAQGRLERRFARGHTRQTPGQRRRPVPAPQATGAEM